MLLGKSFYMCRLALGPGRIAAKLDTDAVEQEQGAGSG